MASTNKCPYCGSVLRSDEKRCPGCGAVNKAYIEDKPRVIRQPKTIEELKEYCAERGMPLLRMRFFVGEDFKEPKAFGIYRDGKDVVVYKNKADGSRAVRYKGPNEAHGVNELFQKLLDECHKRGIYPEKASVSAQRGEGSRSVPETEAEPQLPEGVSPPKTLAELQERCIEEDLLAGKHIEEDLLVGKQGFMLGETNQRGFSGITRKEGKYCIYTVQPDGSRVYSYRSEDESKAAAQYYAMILAAKDRGQNSPGERSVPEKQTARSGKLLKAIGLCLAFPFLVALGIVPMWIYLIDMLVCAILKKNRTWPRECQRELESEDRSRLQKLWSALRYSFRYGPKSGLGGQAQKTYLWVCWIAPLFRAALAIALAVGMILSIKALIHRNDGYYRAPDNTIYYQDGGSWYYYDPEGGNYDWYPAADFPADHYQDYQLDEGWERDWEGVSYSDGSVWEAPHSSSSDSDSDSWSSSDYDSWDSGGTDWDSDW